MVKRKNRIRRIALLISTIMLLITITAVTVIDTKLRPLLSLYSNNQATTAATKAINAAAERIITQTPVTYDEFSFVHRDSSDKISSIEVNTENINRIKSSVSNAVLEELANQRFQYVTIPTGSLFGGLVTGRGPCITIKVPMDSTAETDYVNSFSGAGINQTRHSISIVIKVSIFAVIQGEEMFVETQSEFLLTESILIGEVPNWISGITASQ